MAEGVQTGPAGHDSLIQAVKVAHDTPVQHSPNGIRFAAYGHNNLAPGELERIVQAVPSTIAAALARKAYYFVPLAMAEPELAAQHDGTQTHRTPGSPTLIAIAFTPELADQAICHRNVSLGNLLDDTATEGVFISTRLLNDRFALAFEFFINIGHAFVESVGVPAGFNALLWEHVIKDVRGETSLDAWEARAQSRNHARTQPSTPTRKRPGTLQLSPSTPEPSTPIDERARTEFLEAAFADALAIYLLSLSVDFNYSELREREYPLLAPAPLAERLRLAAKLFPPNPGYEFSIRYRRRA